MSAYQHYRELGYSPISPKTRDVSNGVASKMVIWTPTSSMRIAVTEVAVAASSASGTIEFRFGGANSDQKLATFTVAGSATIFPVITAWESTAADAPLYINTSSGLTNAYSITVGGFEID